MMMVMVMVMVVMMMMMTMTMIMTIVSVEQRPGWGEHVQTNRGRLHQKIRKCWKPNRPQKPHIAHQHSRPRSERSWLYDLWVLWGSWKRPRELFRRESPRHQFPPTIGFRGMAQIGRALRARQRLRGFDGSQTRGLSQKPPHQDSMMEGWFHESKNFQVSDSFRLFHERFLKYYMQRVTYLKIQSHGTHLTAKEISGGVTNSLGSSIKNVIVIPLLAAANAMQNLLDLVLFPPITKSCFIQQTIYSGSLMFIGHHRR